MYERNENRGQGIVGKLVQKYNIFGLFILMKFLEWYFSDQTSQGLISQDKEYAASSEKIPIP